MNSSKVGHLKVVQGGKVSLPIDPLEERQFGKPVRQHVREFGAVFGVLFSIIACFQARHPERATIFWSLAVAAPLIYLLCVAFPRLMHPVWKGWMRMAEVIAVVMNTVLLFAVWATVVVPIGILLKLIGKRVMDLSFRAPVQTYWETRPDSMSEYQLLERQY